MHNRTMLILRMAFISVQVFLLILLQLVQPIAADIDAGTRIATQVVLIIWAGFMLLIGWLIPAIFKRFIKSVDGQLVFKQTLFQFVSFELAGIVGFLTFILTGASMIAAVVIAVSIVSLLRVARA